MRRLAFALLLGCLLISITSAAQAGTVVGWGKNDYGQATPPEGLEAIQIAAGYDHSLAICPNGTVVGWGKNDYGQATPPEGLEAIQIAAGNYHSLAICPNGTVVGWGKNDYGQATPPEGLVATQIAAGYHHSLAICPDGTVVAWGVWPGAPYDNYYKQTLVPAGLEAIQVAAGGWHSLAICPDGTVVGWGRDNYKQNTPPAGLVATQIAAGAQHSLALRPDGTVVGWGRNIDKETTIPAGLEAIQVAAGGTRSLAICPDGTVVGWGRNDYGQGTPPEGLEAIQIAAGYHHSLAIAAPPPAPPVATFSATPTAGDAPLTVRFTDTSSNAPTSRMWNFGDGATSTDRNPTHTYTDPGSYTVTLTVSNEYGNDAVVKTNLIKAAYTAYPPCNDLTISAADITAQSVTLSGSTPYPEVWIVFGAAPGKYGYQSSIITTNTSDYSATIVSLPLIAGQTYYARAGTDGGYSPEVSFTLPPLTPAPVTTHGDIFHTLMAGNLSIGDFWTAEADLYARPFGGGDFGAAVFISLLSAIVFVVLFLRSGDVIVPFMVGALVGGLLIPYLLPQFTEIGYACMVAAMIGTCYSLYRRYL